jgi:hypothetical protein
MGSATARASAITAIRKSERVRDVIMLVRPSVPLSRRPGSKIFFDDHTLRPKPGMRIDPDHTLFQIGAVNFVVGQRPDFQGPHDAPTPRYQASRIAKPAPGMIKRTDGSISSRHLKCRLGSADTSSVTLMTLPSDGLFPAGSQNNCRAQSELVGTLDRPPAER